MEELLSSETFVGSLLTVDKVHACYDQMGLRFSISAERYHRCRV